MATASPGADVPLHAVEDLHRSRDGLVWILDNGRRAELNPKVVAWNPDKQAVKAVYHIAEPAKLAASFLAEMVVDPESPLVILSDPASDSDAALILLDRSSGISRRVMKGHPALVPDKSVHVPNTATAGRKRLDGSTSQPHTGVRALAIDDDAEWLYFAPVRTKRIYRVAMKFMRDSELPEQTLAAKVEIVAESGPCTSLAIDEDGNLYAADPSALGVMVLERGEKEFRPLLTDARLLYPKGLTFSEDGMLCLFSRSLHTPISNAGSPPPHTLYRIKPLSEGAPGR
jgi:hypothetical protein